MIIIATMITNANKYNGNDNDNHNNDYNNNKSNDDNVDENKKKLKKINHEEILSFLWVLSLSMKPLTNDTPTPIILVVNGHH